MNEWQESAFAETFPAGAQRVMEYNEAGNYEGYGVAIALHEGKFLVATYSHCSCNGPDETCSLDGTYDCLVEALRGSGASNITNLLKELDKEARLG